MEVQAELSKFKEEQELEMGKFRAENKAEKDTVTGLSQQTVRDMNEMGQLEQAKILEEKMKM